MLKRALRMVLTLSTTAALHRLQACYRVFRPGRDGLLVSNTWGDRNRDSRINEPFVRAEIAAGAALGVDVCQVDDGWQKGITANSSLVAKGGVWNGFWAAELNLMQLFSRVRTATQGELSIDLTAEVRPGYFGAMPVGPLFLENRYSDWRQWFPHATLRYLWVRLE